MEPHDSALAAARLFDTLGIQYEQAFGHQPERREALDWLIAQLPAGARCFVLATAPADLEELDVTWMGQPLRVTSYPTERYLELLRAAGLEIVHARTSLFRPDFPDMGEEEDLFCCARRPVGSAR